MGLSSVSWEPGTTAAVVAVEAQAAAATDGLPNSRDTRSAVGCDIRKATAEDQADQRHACVRVASSPPLSETLRYAA